MPDPRVAAAAATLHLDRQALFLVRALDGVGIPSLILKGPALRTWLYPVDGRPYGDIDLLVQRSHYAAAQTLLEDNGYVDPMPGARGSEVSLHARPLAHPSGSVVDLHTRLSGTTAPEELVWNALSTGSRPLALAGGEIQIPSQVGLLLIVVLHAAQHGALETKPLEDLRRAAAVVTEDELTAAADLADQLGAGESFTAGLLLDPMLRELAPAVADQKLSRSVRARASGTYMEPGVRLLLRASSGSWRDRFHVIGRAAWPTNDWLRVMMGPPRGWAPGWFALARVRRWVHQLRTLPSALSRLRKLQ